jgi:molecular chaperone IbpA
VALPHAPFERQFHLADHVRAVGASYEDGMLHIELIREVPEALKPRRIQIQSKSPLQVEASPA